MMAMIAALILSMLMPADDKPQQQAQGGGGIESSVPGIPVSNPKISQEAGKPPSIVYPPSRQSNKWVDAGEALVAIDGGIEWHGKIAYLALTPHLVVTDAKTQKTLWHSGESAFWNTLTFEDLAKPGQPAQWAVVLKSSAYPEYSQCYDLNSGKRLALRGAPPQPPGTILTPRKSWSGTAGVSTKRTHLLIASAEDWSKLRKELFGDKPQGIPEASEFDFTKEMLLVLYTGVGFLNDGLSPALVVESEKSIVVRVEVHYYQVVLGTFSPRTELPDEHPYGLIVLPRRPNKPVVLEYNEQIYIGGPEFWKEKERLSLEDNPKAKTAKDR